MHRANPYYFVIKLNYDSTFYNQFLLGTFQFLAIGFNVTFLVLSTHSFHYEIISATVKITNASRTKQDTPFKILMILLPLITIATFCRIFFTFAAVFFLKAWSIIPLSALALLTTFNLTRKGANSFKESLAMALMFLAPFQLGRETMPSAPFSRISCYAVTSFGYLTAGIVLILDLKDQFEDGSYLAPDPCSPEWMSQLIDFIFPLGALYGILTELHISCFERFYKCDGSTVGMVIPSVEQQHSV